MYDAINDSRVTIMQMISHLVKSYYEWDDCQTFKKRRKKCIKLLKNDLWICKNVNFNWI
jgi:hypothetical protein